MCRRAYFILLTLLVYNLYIKQVYAQSLVTVNTLTGAGSLNIPIYAVNSGSVTLPISLFYLGTGVKVKDVENTAGMNWSLNAGGQISRDLKGLPDDVTRDDANYQNLGWMSPNNTLPTYINNFNIQNDGSSRTCSDESADFSYLNYFNHNWDSEPDYFNVSAPGLSVSLVFDRSSNKFVPINFKDIKISYVAGSTGVISSFTITNDKGITYTFGQATYVTQKTSGGSHQYFEGNYTLFMRGITYVSDWKLTKMADASGNAIILNYTQGISRSSTDKINLYLNGSSTPTFQYAILQTYTPTTLSSIQTTNINNNLYTAVSFVWGAAAVGNTGTNQTILTNINTQNRYFTLFYNNVANSNGFTKYFLRSFSEAGCNSPVNYQFGYVGETISPNAVTTTLPDSTSNQIDYWGYYSANSNTSLQPKIMMIPNNNAYQRYGIYSAAGSTAYNYLSNGNSRVANPLTVMTGSLNKVKYPEGGSTTIVYESNDYFDVPSGNSLQGGGIRVKQLIDSAGTGSSVTVKNYSYIDGNGNSSGKPVTLPAFGFTFPNNSAATGQSLWAQSTVLSDNDLSAEDHTILYSNVKLSVAGAGSTRYLYLIPATYWDQSAAPSCSGCTTEWVPTQNLVARDNCTVNNSWLMSNSTYAYPYIPNPNYDFERGLPQKVTSYNENGMEVSETNYTYTRVNAPGVITAFKNEANPDGSLLVKAYNKYLIYYNTGELSASVNSKVFDSPSLSQNISTTTNYTYGSPNHRLLTQQQTTNSDGSVLTTKMSYVKDYAVSAGSNANITALYNLQQQNNNAPVETYQQITRSGSTLTTVGSLMLYKPAIAGSATNYLLSQELKFSKPLGGSFNPVNINASNQTVTYDNQYTTTNNITDYDNTGFPVTSNDNHKNYRTTLAEHTYNNIIGIFNNASVSEIGFSDFDSIFPAAPNTTFTINGSGSNAPTGHTGGGYNLGTSQSLTKTIVKNITAKNYIFSVWLNSSSAGVMTINLNGGGSSNTATISYNTAGLWKYYEVKVPLTNQPASFTATITANTAVIIDDVILYPDVAEVTTYAYDPVQHSKITETNTNGVSTYVNYDQWGRLLYQLDQDKNIMLRNSYIMPNNIQSFGNPSISYTPSNNVTSGTPVTFTAGGYDACTGAGLTYTWNFGDASPVVTMTSAVSPAHPFPYNSATTNYTVTLTVTSPYYGQKSSTVTVSVSPVTGTISYVNNASAAGITSVTMTGPQNYTYSNSTLNGGVFIPGNYTINIHPNGGYYSSGNGKGYTFIQFSDGSSSQCFPYNNGNDFNFSWNLSSANHITFTVLNTATCTGGGGGNPAQ